MSLYDAARIEKPKYLKLGPLKVGRGNRKPHVVGFDTEASRGQPILLQFSEGGGPEAADLLEVPDRPNACIDRFMDWTSTHCRSRGQEHIIVGFNLQYEWTQLFGDMPAELAAAKEFEVIWEGPDQRWRLTVWNHRRHAMTMLGETNHVRVRVLDAAAFFPGSLNAVAGMVGVERKDDMDKQWLANLTRADLSDPLFRHYAAQDAVVTRLIGERIVTIHEEYDLQTCMTAPQFASRVFRRHFLNAVIPLPNLELEQAGLASYHGGKNGFYLKEPTRTRAWNMDIVSAYPEAMRALPALENSQWHQRTTYKPGVHALWQVRMDHRPCRYVGAMEHGGQPLRRGYRDVWITGYELDPMVERRELFNLTVLDGWVLEGPHGGGALVNYVDTFFAKKQVDTGPARATDKLLLNALYGKFFQKQPLGSVGNLEGIMDPETLETVFYEVSGNPLQDYDYRAGGLYHPPIASLITGFVRGKVHRLEHRYDAIATSTDGFFARKPPWTADRGTELGKLTAEEGVLDIWRERLYAFGDGREHYTKAALHGFRGNAEALREIPLKPGSYSYTARHPVTLRESQQLLRGSRYRPGEFAALTFTLDLSA